MDTSLAGMTKALANVEAVVVKHKPGAPRSAAESAYWALRAAISAKYPEAKLPPALPAPQKV